MAECFGVYYADISNVLQAFLASGTFRNANVWWYAFAAPELYTMLSHKAQSSFAVLVNEKDELKPREVDEDGAREGAQCIIDARQ